MIAGQLRERAGELALCLSFYTRLPMPQGFLGGPGSFAQAQWAAPLVGAVVGLIGGLVYAAGWFLYLPPLCAATLALAATMLATGCLHEDGLCDTADGFGGGATRERKLEIMRDSRLGTYGASALLLSLMLRGGALAAIGSPVVVGTALIAAHASARAMIPAFMRMVPLARRDGLAAKAGIPSRNVVLAAMLLGTLSLLPLGPLPALAAVVALLICLVLLRKLGEQQIGGSTGDVLGSLEQCGEIAVLLVAAAAAR